MTVDMRARYQRHARYWFTRLRKRFYPNMPPIRVEVGAGKLNCASWGETQFENDEPVLVRIAEHCWTQVPTANHGFVKTVILHELCHCHLGVTVDHDSPEWNAEVLRLSRLGALLLTL